MKIQYEFYNQWESLNPLAELGWRDFTIVNLAFERTYYVDRYLLEVGLLGLNLNVNFIKESKDE